jgi:DeoR/GlpR family transcriptional regulator of sugar metabolism
MAAICRQVWGLFDSSKVERFGTHPFAPVDRVTGLISDTGVPAAIHREWTQAGIVWDLVDPDAEPSHATRAGPVKRHGHPA